MIDMKGKIISVIIIFLMIFGTIGATGLNNQIKKENEYSSEKCQIDSHITENIDYDCNDCGNCEYYLGMLDNPLDLLKLETLSYSIKDEIDLGVMIVATNDFQKKHFEWASTSQGGGCAGIDIGINLEACPPDFIFNNKGRGNCGAFTTFAVDCLRKAGYQAYPLSIYKKWPDSLAPGHQPRDYHIMTLYKENGKWYTMDNGITNYTFFGLIGDINQTVWDIKESGIITIIFFLGNL